MIKIKKIYNEDEIHHYKFNIFTNIHNELINFLNSLNFSEDELIKIDTPFSELDGEYLFVKKEDMKIHFFITADEVNMVIDSKESQETISNLMRKYFSFPK